ncbi:hypothetical protein [Moellerella wisconsensis]|uniref:hypothetical protein n=1 Tax=Moellerella wisconsensis TaxID=158849 RepID=UPI00240F0B51|nr:hypothetical protein [Moellerella wisconsensis]
MGKFKHWLKLVVYRFTLSNDELSKCLADRRSMDEFRRKASDVKQRMKLHELAGGRCNEDGGEGIPLTFQGIRLKAYQPAEVTILASRSTGSNVVDLSTRRKRRDLVNVISHSSHQKRCTYYLNSRFESFNSLTSDKKIACLSMHSKIPRSINIAVIDD